MTRKLRTQLDIRINGDHSTVYVALDDSALLDIPGHILTDTDTVTWKQGDTRLGTVKQNFSVNNSNTTFNLYKNGSLYFHRLVQEGRRNYTVEVHNSTGKSIIQHNFTVQVIVKVSVPNVTFSCLRDGQAEITCDVERGSDPSYSWTVNGELLDNSISRRWNVNGNKILGFTPVSVTVNCSVKNPLSEERSLPLQVFCPVPVPVPALNISCQPNGSALISCRVHKGTDPVYSWNLNDKVLQGYWASSTNGSEISVPRPASGNISCTVTNQVNNETNSTDFSCPVPVSVPVLVVSCPSDRQAVISCYVEEGSDPHYTWESGGTLLENRSDTRWNVTGNTVTVTLPFPRNISCTVENSITKKTSSLPVVHCPVPLSEPALNISCLPDGRAQISCRALNGTDPFYFFSVNGEMIYQNSSSPVVNYTVHLLSPGNINCTVRNDISESTTIQSVKLCPGVPCSNTCLKKSIIGGSVALLVTTLPLIIGCMYTMPKPAAKP